ncbi:MAG: hypothetical protein AB9M60_03660, partial [Leptothrix sp. (in: b-proteobacteria)]
MSALTRGTAPAGQPGVHWCAPRDPLHTTGERWSDWRRWAGFHLGADRRRLEHDAAAAERQASAW